MEAMLKSWVPRPPSPRVRKPLFAFRPPDLKANRPSIPWNPWLAPAMVCVLFLLAVPQGRFDSWVGTRGISGSNPLHSGREGAGSLAFTVEQNAPPNPRIERLLAMDVGSGHAAQNPPALHTNQILH